MEAPPGISDYGYSLRFGGTAMVALGTAKGR